MQRSIMALAALAIVGVLASWSPALADAPEGWVRSFTEQRDDGCTYYVAEWSDGTFTSTPWRCPTGTVATREDGATASRGINETGDDGCVWAVTQWDDGSYTKVPRSCPDSPAAEAAPTATPTPEVVEPTATPQAQAGGSVAPSAPATGCCKVCGADSKPCGNTCIALNKNCRTAPGCACQ